MASMRFGLPRRAVLLIALALLLAPGCQSKRYLVGFELPAGEAAELVVLGEQLRIQVDNEGPGNVVIAFDSPVDARDEHVEIGVGTTVRSMPGPVRLLCTSSGVEGTQVDVRAWGCDGMSLDQTPEPRTPPGPD